ncbi:MAG TPA: hypothetical protein VFE45_18770, partial [Coriobacteriia bacterium]|nr:hypothetical protein [Coriobacteriia bacterium]
VMDAALRDRVIEELRRSGYGECGDYELRRLTGTVVGQTTAMRVAMVDLAEVFTRDTWPGRMLVRLADVSSRALALLAHR